MHQNMHFQDKKFLIFWKGEILDGNALSTIPQFGLQGTHLTSQLCTTLVMDCHHKELPSQRVSANFHMDLVYVAILGPNFHYIMTPFQRNPCFSLPLSLISSQHIPQYNMLY